jgi:CpcD/allophycocyanin linker domain
MATMNITAQSTDLTAYGSRLVTLEVMGVSTRNSHQTILVPLSRLSQKMQQIHRQGGKIVSVNTSLAAAAMPRPAVVESVAPSAPQIPGPPDVEQELVMEAPVVQPKNHQSSKKKRR